MITLIECCKPLIPIRTSLISRSQRPIHVHHRKISINNVKYCNNGTKVLCFSSPGQSTPFIDEKSCEKINGGGAEGKSSSELWLYYTMRKQTEVFRPKVPRKVGMYVCGVTAYDLSHIGHARVYVCFDVLYRYLRRQLGYEVDYVRNFTDVDDEIIARANELGEDPISLSTRYCEEFHQDIVHLHCLPPKEPRVSEQMPQIIDMITQGC